MKKFNLKLPNALTPSDLKRFPVWEFVNDDEVGELALRPVKRVPVRSLRSRLVGSEFRLANGRRVWGLLGNVSVDDPRLTEHVRTIAVECEGVWFWMSRYHDFEAAKRGPEELARFLGLPVEDVFPITYDISSVSLGAAGALVGSIEREPRERLTRSQVISLVVKGRI